MSESGYAHRPVLLAESLQSLNLSPGSVVLDCTFGRGGHSRAFIDAVGPDGTVVALDIDDSASDMAAQFMREYSREQFRFVALSYRDLDVALHMAGVRGVDAVFFDLGVSSPQFDEAERGFSYRLTGPLDMRMNRAQKLTAREVVNTYPEDRLAEIISQYGEEKWAKRIASFIVKARESTPIERTEELVSLIRGAIPKAVREAETQHPARRTFQALRIEVNDELGSLRVALDKSLKVLLRGGRLACISFHSLEDRIVKQFMVAEARDCSCPPGIPQCVCNQVPRLRIVNRKPIAATPSEVLQNPRSRSARLRVAQRV